ncbi:MAG TPA: hypothetical protein VI386_31525 [Candidatus Sulfotelmatobacter sp.]
MKAFPLFISAAFSVIFCLSSFAQTATSCVTATYYKIIALPLHPTRINNKEEIAGAVAGVDEDAGHLATWTQSSGIRELKLPSDFTNAEAVGINAHGDVVGQATSGLGKKKAFAFLRGKFVVLSELQLKAKAINNSRQVTLEQSPGPPQIWSGGEMQPLGGCCGGHVFAINNQGEIAGELNDRDGRFSAFVWDAKHGAQLITPPGARSSTALAINDSGHVLIQTFSPNQIFLRENDKFIPVELSPEFASQPLALNDCDAMVGEYGAASEYYHAFIWDKKNGFRDLNTLIDKAEGWSLESAVDINSHGQIIGTGDHANQNDAGFLLLPQP